MGSGAARCCLGDGERGREGGRGLRLTGSPAAAAGSKQAGGSGRAVSHRLEEREGGCEARRGEARQFPAGSLGRDLAERCGRPEERGERAAGGGFADCPVVSSADTRLGTANGFGAGVKARAVHLPLGW